MLTKFKFALVAAIVLGTIAPGIAKERVRHHGAAAIASQASFDMSQFEQQQLP
jgi:hypothetical protein